MDGFRAGQRVFLRCAPHHTGTVSHVSAEGFTVIYDTPQRKRHQPRSKFRYRWPMAPRLATGQPARED